MRRALCIGLALAAFAAAADAAAAPRITVRPTSSPPGRLVTVSGRGFCAAAGCSAVRIFVFGQPVAGGVHVAPGGTFVKRVRVPGVTSPEENGVLASQRLASGAQASAFADFEVVLRFARPASTPATTAEAPQRATTATTATPPAVETTPPITRPRTTKPVTERTPTATESTPSPDTGAATATASTAASPVAPTRVAAGATADDGAGDQWGWLAVLAGAGLLVGAAGWAIGRRRVRRSGP